MSKDPSSVELRVSDLEARIEELEAVIQHVEGALLGYWTDIPQEEIEKLLEEIRATYARSTRSRHEQAR